MGLLNISVHCQKCDETYDMLVDSERRNDEHLCDLCDGGMVSRVWTPPNVSTAKTSASIPDGVTKRFEGAKVQSQVKRELSKAKREYAANPSAGKAEDIKRLRKEVKKT